MGLCLLALGCASADELSRRSQEDLGAGHVQKAYDQAKKALKKDGSNAPARAALSDAGAALTGQRQDQVLALAAAGDTLGAAGEAVRLDDLRREMAELGAGSTADTAFARAALQIRTDAASLHYRKGLDLIDQERPKQAYDEFLEARRMVPGYRDVEVRIRSSYEAALSRVAILPFENQTNVRGLSMDMATEVQNEVGRRLDPKEFRFTALLGADEVFARVPVSALARLERDDALRIARDLDADRIVVGSFHALRSEKTSESYTITVYRKGPPPPKIRKPGAPPTPPEYIPQDLHIVRHRRNTSLSYDFSILDVRDGRSLAARSKTVSATAIVVWTDDEPEGDCDDYSLVSPEIEKNEPDRVKSAHENWKKCAGDWKLHAFLERARHEHEHEHRTYKPDEDRKTFYGFSANHPVFLGELPPEGDLALVALDSMWQEVLAALREADKE